VPEFHLGTLSHHACGRTIRLGLSTLPVHMLASYSGVRYMEFYSFLVSPPPEHEGCRGEVCMYE
jgi:hypothetical protein